MLQNNYEFYVSKISTTLNNIFDHLNVKHDLYSVGPLSEAVSHHFTKTQKVIAYNLLNFKILIYVIFLDYKFRLQPCKCYTY